MANTRYRVELRALCADAGGVAELRIDGTVVVTFTGDTRNAGTGVMNRLELWGPVRSDAVGFTYWDNLTINTASAPAPTGYPGARRIETLMPTSTIAEGFARSDPAIAPHLLVGEAPLVAAVPHGHWKTSTFVAGLRADGIVAPLVLDGAVNGTSFRAYVEQFLAPSLRAGDTVVIDNLGSHKVKGCARPSRLPVRAYSSCRPTART